jgi:hypothetical protein
MKANTPVRPNQPRPPAPTSHPAPPVYRPQQAGSAQTKTNVRPGMPPPVYRPSPAPPGIQPKLMPAVQTMTGATAPQVYRPLNTPGGVVAQPKKKKKFGGAEHTTRKSASTYNKHSAAKGSKANQAKVNAWKKYRQAGGQLSKTAWLRSH